MLFKMPDIPRVGKILLTLMLIFPVMMFGQADRAAITGRVTDPSGAALPGVDVVATQADTGAKFTTVTNDVGLYNLTSLPIGAYNVEMKHSGFENAESSVNLLATQVASLNVQMVVGSTSQSVTVSAAPPLLDTQTSTIATTLEAGEINDLPLNATNGRDAIGLLANTVSSMNFSGTNGNEVYEGLYFAGGTSWTNTIFIDGVDSGAGPQGTAPTPGNEAIQEMQVQASDANAEAGATGSGVIFFELKSGTNKIHGSAFEFLQNEDLNANTWSNNFFRPTCSASDATCIRDYSRPRDRFNDWGGSLGGPLWKNHSFLFGDYEYYTTTNYTLNPNSTTVPTAKMLTGDFSELLTGGTNQGTITNPATGQPWINPCTGTPYQYGQIFDPNTQQIINGESCATPFPGNVIPAGRIGSLSKSIAAIYSKYYQPTISSRIYNNYPTISSNTPSETKRLFDIKFDHNFSDSHHISASFNYEKWISVTGGGLVAGPGDTPGPLSSEWSNNTPNFMTRVIDNYSFSPNILNTFAVGYSSMQYTQVPTFSNAPGIAATYGFNADATGMPSFSFGGSNGVTEAGTGTTVDAYQNYYGYHFQDSLAWQKKNHSLKFGAYVYLQGLNSSYGGNIQQYWFYNQTGGPNDDTLTPLLGSGFANMMVGSVSQAQQNIPYPTYPRQKYLNAYAQDDIKVNHKLTVNLGLLWDFTFAGHQQGGHWTNFDLTQQNPNWGNYKGAWTFASNSGSTFQTDNSYHQFAPHLGAAYQITDKLVMRASYGLYYIPLGEMNSGFGYNFPSQQGEFWTGTNTVPSVSPWLQVFNWENGYPGQTVNLSRSIDQTSMGYRQPYYISPKTLHLGHSQNFYVGIQYQMAKNLGWDVRYVGTRGGALHDSVESVGINYPSFSTYSSLYLSGHVNDQICSAEQAAADNVPYPYPGFCAPAYAAIAPIPQAAGQSSTLVLETDQQVGVSSYNAFVIQMKATGAHGVHADLNYTLSRLTGSNLARRTSAYNGIPGYQSADDITNSRHWVQGSDQRHLAEGYVTYDLPLGKGQRWLSGSRTMDTIFGGWTIGGNVTYGSGTPLGTVPSPYSYPFFFQQLRDNFANGANPFNMKNLFHRHHVNLADTTDPSNRDFDTSDFATPTPGTLGNTPYNYNNWRWNSGAASENGEIRKGFGFGRDNRFRATIRAEFFDLFNRHYINSPDLNPNDQNFGQVTGVSGTSRNGQLSARFDF